MDQNTDAKVLRRVAYRLPGAKRRTLASLLALDERAGVAKVRPRRRVRWVRVAWLEAAERS